MHLMPTKERKPETIAFRVTDDVYRMLNRLADQERRKVSEIVTALLARGVAAYNRDGRLFEPEAVPAQKPDKRKTRFAA